MSWANFEAALDLPVRVIGLTVPLAVIRARLTADPTRGRESDLARTEAWLARGADGVPVDLAIDGDRPVATVAREIVSWLGWRS